MAIVDIIIRTIDKGGGDLKNLNSSLGQLATKYLSLAAAATTVVKVIGESIKATFAYDDAVRKLAQTSGTSAEEASRLLQVMDDYKLTAQDVTTATRFLTKNGLSPTLSTIEELSDAYRSLNTGQEKAEFLFKNFGRSGLKFAEVMAAGGDKLKQMGTEVEKSLIRTDAQIAQTRLFEFELDAMTDKVDAAKVSFGSGFLGVLDGSTNAINQLTEQTFKLNTGFTYAQYIQKKGRGGFEELKAAAHDTAVEQYLLSQGIDVATESMEAQAEALEEIDYKNLISDTINMQSEMDRYTQTQDEANAAIEQANADFKAGKINAEERDAALAASTEQLAANAEAHTRWAAETVYAFAMARAAADGEITEGEGQVLIALGQQLDLFDQETAEAMQAVNESFSTLDASNATAVIATVQGALEALTGQPWVITLQTDTSGVELPSQTSTPTTNVRDSGGSGYPGVPYLIGTGAQPEVFVPDQPGTFYPNASMGQVNNFYGCPVTLIVENSESLVGTR